MDIADAAIEVLARAGTRGLSHRAVDEEAGVPAGTTSNYFRTRKALLEAVGARLLEHQVAEMAKLPVPRTLDDLVALVTGVVQAPERPRQARYLARFELFLEGTRDPDLLPTLVKVRESVIIALTRGLAAAGYQGDPEGLQAAGSALQGLLFDQLVFHNTPWKTEEAVRAVLATFVFGKQPAGKQPAAKQPQEEHR